MSYNSISEALLSFDKAFLMFYVIIFMVVAVIIASALMLIRSKNTDTASGKIKRLPIVIVGVVTLLLAAGVTGVSFALGTPNSGGTSAEILIASVRAEGVPEAGGAIDTFNQTSAISTDEPTRSPAETASSITVTVAPTESSSNGIVASPAVSADNGSSSAVSADSGSKISVTDVSLGSSSKSLTTGQTFTISATVSPSDATNQNVSWSSSNNSVASVSGSGRSVTVQANSAGSAKITVKTSDGGFSATCNVTVTDPTVSVSGVSLNYTSKSMTTGQSFSLTATVSPSDATNKNVMWSSSNSSVASVSGSGSSATVTASAAGSATITVTTADGSFTANCSVSVASAVVAVTGLSLSDTSRSVTPSGGSFTLTATISPSNATNQNISWSSSSSNVTISGSGTAVTINTNGSTNAVGTYTITARTADGNYSAACSVTIKLWAPENLHIQYTNSDTVSVGWNNVNGAVGYNVYFNGNFMARVGTSEYTKSGLSPNTEYYVKVYAVDSTNNNGFQSDNLSARTAS